LECYWESNIFYQRYFQSHAADREMQSDPRRFLLGAHYSLSGSVTGADRWRLFLEKGEGFNDTVKVPEHFPSWESQQAQDHYVSEYTRSGFWGALNHYRCRDKNWEDTSFLDGAVVRQPSISIVGAADPSWPYMEAAHANLGTHIVNLRNNVLLPGVGHSAAEEQPAKVNELPLAYLKDL
jgi:pimeloyl-ACP methyl ester carboxylesterase